MAVLVFSTALPAMDTTLKLVDDFAPAEKASAYIKEHPRVELFGTDRLSVIWRDDLLPTAWLSPSPGFVGKPQPGEFYPFQVSVLNGRAAGVKVLQAKLRLEGAGDKMHCLFFEVQPPESRVTDGLGIPSHEHRTLWFASEIDAPGTYEGVAELLLSDVSTSEMWRQSLPVKMVVAGPKVTNAGTDEAWRMSRLKWLLPTSLGLEDSPTKGFEPVTRKGSEVRVLGRSLTIGSNGLPQQIVSRFNGSNTGLVEKGKNMLARPVELVVETASGPIRWEQASIKFHDGRKSSLSWTSDRAADGLTWQCEGKTEFDGFCRFTVKLTAQKDLDLRDIRFDAPYREDSAKYMLGLGFPGGNRPNKTEWLWDTSQHRDSVWLGDVNIGAQWRFKGANYRRPLVNIYYGYSPLRLPESWGTGGIRVGEAKDGVVRLQAFTGPRKMHAGETLEFTVESLLTPFRPIKTDEQWATRYFHTGDLPDEKALAGALKTAVDSGANVMNIHHCSVINPFINYPFNDESVGALKAFVKETHSKNLRTKIYYTTRELTQLLPEIWALRTFEGAVIQPGPGPSSKTIINPNGPHPWLNEHLRTGFIPAWVATLGGKYAGKLDLAVLTRPDSAWNEFFLSGLDWLARNVAIDGIYIDDTALSREALQRTRRILDHRRPNPLIDLHSWSHEDPLAGSGSSASIYMDLFPYVDRIWFGEGFDYSRSPDYYLVAMAGIPYGVMSEMLQGGGNPWRGMLFGMTTRLGWSGDPRPIWKAWDAFGMAGTEMIGWWDSRCPVKTDSLSIPATVYRGKGKMLVAIASWDDRSNSVTLRIDWKALGLDPMKVKLVAHAIEGYQPVASWTSVDAIRVEPGKGWLIEIRE